MRHCWWEEPLFGDGAVGGAGAHVGDAGVAAVGRCGEQFAHACIYGGVVDAVAVVFHIGHAHEGVVFSKSACEGGACDLQAFGCVDVVAVVVATADWNLWIADADRFHLLEKAPINPCRAVDIALFEADGIGFCTDFTEQVGKWVGNLPCAWWCWAVDFDIGVHQVHFRTGGFGGKSGKDAHDAVGTAAVGLLLEVDIQLAVFKAHTVGTGAHHESAVGVSEEVESGVSVLESTYFL